MTDTEWWRDHDNIVFLVHWLADHGTSAKDVAYAVEKPWKFEDEYRQARIDNAAEEAEAEQHMHRNRGESYLAMLIRNRQQTPSVSFGTQDTSGATS